MRYQKFRRLELGLRSKDVARRAGLNPTIYINIENGRMNPRGDELARIAKALGCPVARLLAHVSEADLTIGANGA